MALGTRLLDGASNVLAKIHAKYGLTNNDGVLHVSPYPPAVAAASEGAYHASLLSGTMAAGLGSGSQIFQFRWTSATQLCVLRSVKMSASVAGTAFSAGVPSFEMVLGRSYTVSGSGGTAATLTTNNGKNRTGFATTAVGDMRISNTAALTGGTVTLDGNAFASIVGVTGTATTGQIVPPNTDIYHRYHPDEYPVVFATNEGFIIRTTVPATGTWTFAVSVEWSEYLLANF